MHCNRKPMSSQSRYLYQQIDYHFHSSSAFCRLALPLQFHILNCVSLWHSWYAVCVIRFAYWRRCHSLTPHFNKDFPHWMHFMHAFEIASSRHWNNFFPFPCIKWRKCSLMLYQRTHPSDWIAHQNLLCMALPLWHCTFSSEYLQHCNWSTFRGIWRRIKRCIYRRNNIGFTFFIKLWAFQLQYNVTLCPLNRKYHPFHDTLDICWNCDEKGAW